jgi:uncharacterized protein (UPF0264 family)
MIRTLIYSKDSKPRKVAELTCDIELLVQCVKDGEIIPNQVAKDLNEFVQAVTKALHIGLAKRKAEAEQD